MCESGVIAVIEVGLIRGRCECLKSHNGDSAIHSLTDSVHTVGLYIIPALEHAFCSFIGYISSSYATNVISHLHCYTVQCSAVAISICHCM